MNDNWSGDMPCLLLVDDDPTFCQVLAGALRRRDFDVIVAHNVDEALDLIGGSAPEYAVVDLNMPGSSGLTLVKRLREMDEEVHILVLTGYASVATAVEAIKLGATHYLAKPADADEIVAALHQDEGNIGVEVPGTPASVKRLEWEHIQRVLVECDGNVSAAARKLGMHRRTLQRKLAKRPVKA